MLLKEHLPSLEHKTLVSRIKIRAFPAGPAVRNTPSNAGDTGSSPGRPTEIPHGIGQLNQRAATRAARVPQVESPCAITAGLLHTTLERSLLNEDPLQSKFKKKIKK